MDRQLQALAMAAEAGETCPAVRLVTASSMLIGVPASSSEFHDKMEWAIAEDIWNLGDRPRKKDAEGMTARYNEVTHQARRLNAPIRARAQTDDSPGREVITLAPAQWWPVAGGDGLDLPAARVPLASVDAWWVAGGKKLRAGGTWFFGAFISTET